MLESKPGYPYLVARIDEVGEAEISFPAGVAARMHQLKERARKAISLLAQYVTEIASAIEQLQIAVPQLADFIANVSDLTPAEKQDLLERFSVADELDKLLRYLAQQIEVLRLSKQIGEQTQESLAGRQREHILREQLHQKFRRNSAKATRARPRSPNCASRSRRPGCRKRRRSRLATELKRLERMPEASAEYGMIRWYPRLVDRASLVAGLGGPHRYCRGAAHPR